MFPILKCSGTCLTAQQLLRQQLKFTVTKQPKFTVTVCQPFSTTAPQQLNKKSKTVGMLKANDPSFGEAGRDPIFQFVKEGGAGGQRPAGARVYVWGNAEVGALGQAGFLMPRRKKHLLTTMHKPFRLTFAEYYDVLVAACGYGFTVFATKHHDSKLFGTGFNQRGQIGFHTRDRGTPLEVIVQPAEIKIPIECDDGVRSLSCGRAHTLVATKQNRVFTLGDNSYGQCGRSIIGEEDYSRTSVIHEVKLEGSPDVASVVAGQDHSFILTGGGQLLAAGWGADGQTGQGHYENTSQFSPVEGELMGQRIVKVACTADCVLALNDKGEVFGWGNSEYGQFHTVTEEQQLPTPTHLQLGIGKVIDIASGGTVCLAVNEDGEVFVWGYGILGKGPNLSMATRPEKIPTTLFGRNQFSPNVRVTAVFAGMGHQAALNSEGDLYTWGKNRNGCLGLGTEQDRNFPLKVSVGARVTEAALGVDHTVVMAIPWI